MKKWLLIFAVLIVILFGCIYVLIPSVVNISEVTRVNCTSSAATRILNDSAKWYKWWPRQSELESKELNYNDHSFHPGNDVMSTVGVAIKKDNDSMDSRINITPFNVDSAIIQWQCGINIGNNPFNKVQKYFEAKKVKDDIEQLLSHLQTFLNKQENIYGSKIIETHVKDEFYVSASHIFHAYPSTQDIYAIIEDLQKFAQRKGAAITDYPIMNVRRDDTSYNTMIALPVDKIIEDEGEFHFKRMIPLKILVTEVRGGAWTAEEAFRQLNNYVQDYQFQSPAIPFLSLVTDRLHEPDTAKWITRAYYPVL